MAGTLDGAKRLGRMAYEVASRTGGQVTSAARNSHAGQALGAAASAAANSPTGKALGDARTKIAEKTAQLVRKAMASPRAPVAVAILLSVTVMGLAMAAQGAAYGRKIAVLQTTNQEGERQLAAKDRE